MNILLLFDIGSLAEFWQGVLYAVDHYQKHKIGGMDIDMAQSGEFSKMLIKDRD